MDIQRVQTILEAAGEPKFRLDQIKEAVYKGLVSDWNEVTTLSAALRAKLNAETPIFDFEIVRQQESSRGDTIKAAFKLTDGNVIETVLMKHHGGRNTVCVSSQAGCPMACTFCATGTMGLKRNLTVSEIVDQVLFFARLLKSRGDLSPGASVKGEKVTNMVFMGMGEPMHNYDAVMTSARILNDQKGFSMGARHISISTCGIVAGILRMADEPQQFNLAISLHAPNDELRSRLMPVNRAYPLAKLMPAVETYLAKTNRKVMFEYLLIKDLNDTPEVADELAKLLAKPLYHLNLIKYHTTGAFETSPFANRSAFMDRLIKQGVSVTHRISFGEDIDAACGQLANKES